MKDFTEKNDNQMDHADNLLTSAEKLLSRKKFVRGAIDLYKAKILLARVELDLLAR